MFAPTATLARPVRMRWPIVLAAAIGGIYAFGHLSWFLATPLGRVPVLDARENLALANTIAAGQLPAEPFYRAPGYALLLAGLRVCGVSAGILFGMALTLGAVCHAINAALAATISARWFGGRAALVAGLLVALNPVLVHFAIQASDATPALTLFLAGLACLAPELVAATHRLRTRRWIAASLFWAAATAVRPNYFPLWLTLPCLAALAARSVSRTFGAGAPNSDERAGVIALIIAACSGALLFAVMAGWQYKLCGRAGFLPTQGAYNLWAANQPGAHGRYYTQKLALPATVAEQNPARAESILLYENETGQAARDFDVVNRYWRGRFVAYAVHHPVAWAAQLGRKFYALLNTWEQYNNETPAFHIERSPWLRWNPLSWGVLLVAATAGFAAISATQRELANMVSILCIALAASAVLFFVSARFRLPLVPVISMCAAVVCTAPPFWSAWSKRRQIVVATSCVALALVTFSNFDAVRDRSTYVQDYALLARAAATVGNDTLAWHEAEAALALRPDHPDALRLAVASYFNVMLNDPASTLGERSWHAAATRLLQTATPDAPDLRAVAALAVWRAGERDAALAEWRRLGPTPSALGARMLARDPSFTPNDAERLAAQASHEPLAQLAIATLDAAGRPDTAALRATAARLFHSSSAAP